MRSSTSIMRSLLSISSSSSSSAIAIPHHHHHHHHHHHQHHHRVVLPFNRTTRPLLRTPAATSSSSVLRSHCSVPAATCRYTPLHQRPGEIHVIIGPMFAGKTTALLRWIRAEIASGRTAAIIKSDKDTRYGLDSAVTHDGTKMPCFAMPELSMFKDKFGTQAYNELDVIGIDEAQFFEDLHDFCRNAAERDGKTVVVAGLDGDYLRRRFGSVLDIIPLADSVAKLTARCELCGRRAFFTLRKTNETKTELIGGANVYMPVCRQHYIDGQVAIEATKIVLNVEKSAAIGKLK